MFEQQEEVSISWPVEGQDPAAECIRDDKCSSKQRGLCLKSASLTFANSQRKSCYEMSAAAIFLCVGLHEVRLQNVFYTRNQLLQLQ